MEKRTKNFPEPPELLSRLKRALEAMQVRFGCRNNPVHSWRVSLQEITAFSCKPNCVSAGMLAVILATGCGAKEAPSVVSVALPPAQASTEIQNAFEGPGATSSRAIQEKAAIARQALVSNDVEVAYTALLDLKGVSPSLSIQQDMAVRNAILGLVARTCAAAASGDPKAKELAQRMRQTP